jgi:murein DD-endopeptidase MepM/ murein hydrolase activator NlpD
MLSETVFSIASLKMDLPRITAKFQEVDGLIHKTPHTGVDLAAAEGTKLASVGDGIIEKIVDYGNTNIGKGVFIKLENGYRVVYGHLSEISVKTGEKISTGDVIGLSGNTGRSTGPHLHLQAYDVGGQLIDPTPLAKAAFNVKSNIIGNAWDKLVKPITEMKQDIADIKTAGEQFVYWINPIHWVEHGWKWLDTNISNGALDVPLIVFTIVVIWLTMLGARNPKKYAFWVWIVFWILRGVIFA